MMPYKPKNTEKEYYTIRDISELLNMPISTIEWYLKQGVFPPANARRKSPETKPARIWDKKTIIVFEKLAKYLETNYFSPAGLKKIRDEGFESLKISD